MALSTPLIQLIDRDTISIEIDQKVSDAFRILLSGRMHHLPVVNNGMLVGMLSTTDMLAIKCASLIGDDSASIEFLDRHHTIEEIMSRDPISVSDRATVSDAARQLSAGGFHSLPVVEQGNRLVGIVTTTDLIRHMLDAPPRTDLPDKLKQQLKTLEQVQKAAQAFLNSGMAAMEHQKLERALEAAREAPRVL